MTESAMRGMSRRDPDDSRSERNPLSKYFEEWEFENPLQSAERALDVRLSI